MTEQIQVYENRVYETSTEISDLIRRLLEDENITSTETSSSFLCPLIKEGMHILKSMDHVEQKDDIFIFLDDLACANKFLDQEDITMQTIIDYFDETKPAYVLVNYQKRLGRKIVPFSKIVRDRVGSCVEMALMSQLIFQRDNQESFLCGGGTNQSMVETHAWNLGRIEGQYFIWDCGLRFYAPLRRAETKDGALYLHPNFEKSVGNQHRIRYQMWEQ